VLRRALHDAMRTGLVTRNVADLAKPPAKAPKPKPMWTDEQLRRFLSAVEGDPLAPCFNLVAATGMRRGEAAGLRWSDIDFGGGTISIRRNRVSVGYHVHEGTPKTYTSARTISVDERTMAVMRDHRRAQRERMLANGFRLTDEHYVFCREDGIPYHPESISRCFVRRVKQHGLPHLTFHGLRDLHATLGLQAGVPAKAMSDRLGHSSVAMTLDVYTTVAQPVAQDAADRIARLIYTAEAG
jgi:integrase